MDETKKKPGYKRAIKLLAPILFIALGTASFVYFKSFAPKVKRKSPEVRTPGVDVIRLELRDVQAKISVMGVVKPSRMVSIRSRVSGEVIKMSDRLTPGGYIEKGAEMVRLDSSDYQADEKKAESALEKARADLMIEEGNQRIAREEWRILSENGAPQIDETGLITREPQWRKARAAVASAETDLWKARLNRQRTVIIAPFNALVIENHVEIGSLATAQGAIAAIVSADEYWVEAATPMDRLQMLDIDPETGSRAMVYLQSRDGVREGRAIRVTGKLAGKTRMATVIVRVDNPLGLGKTGGSKAASSGLPALILDDYVSVQFFGKTIHSVIPLPRAALRDGNTVWVYDQGRLSVRKVVLAWKENGVVLVKEGLGAGEMAIVSDLALPVDGMRLMLNDPENGDENDRANRLEHAGGKTPGAKDNGK